MNLHFERRNGYFISEFEVTNDFNLHIEKDPIGQFIVYQRTAGGAYDLVADFGKNKGDDPIIDYDFSALVYPKYIQIKSSVNPAIATITTNGEVNELVYQEKSINITSNGTVAISADSGYNGLAYLENIETLCIPEGVTYIFGLHRCKKLKKVYCPSTITRIDYMCDSCPNLEFVDFSASEQVPILKSIYSFSEASVIVPDDLYDEWIAADYWSQISSKIVKASEYTDE